MENETSVIIVEFLKILLPAFIGAASSALVYFFQRKKIKIEAEKIHSESDSILAEAAKALVEPMTKRINDLTSQLDAMQKELSSLQQSYNCLQLEHDKLKRDYIIISQGVDRLVMQIKSLNVIPVWSPENKK